MSDSNTNNNTTVNTSSHDNQRTTSTEEKCRRQRRVVSDFDSFKAEAGETTTTTTTTGSKQRDHDGEQVIAYSSLLLLLFKDQEEILKMLTTILMSGRDKDVIPQALQTLIGFCSTDIVGSKTRVKANRKFITDNDGVGIIVQVLTMNQAEPNILATGAKALHCLMYVFNEACEKVHRLGGAQTVIKAMKTHKNDAEVQRYSVGFFLNFIWRNTERKKSAVDLNLIEEILTAMAIHPDDTRLQSFACDALYSLCGGEMEYAGRVYKAGGLPAVSTAHLRHPEIEIYAKKAINALNAYLQNN